MFKITLLIGLAILLFALGAAIGYFIEMARDRNKPGKWDCNVSIEYPVYDSELYYHFRIFPVIGIDKLYTYKRAYIIILEWLFWGVQFYIEKHESKK